MANLPDKPTELAGLLEISIPYASQLLSGSRSWTRSLAISAFRKTGIKLGPIAYATDEEITVLERFERPIPDANQRVDAPLPNNNRPAIGRTPEQSEAA